MSTPYGGGDPNQGWQDPGQPPGAPPGPPPGGPPPGGGYPPPAPPPGQPGYPPPGQPGYPPPGQPGYPPPGQPGMPPQPGYGQPDYSQVQPNYGTPYGGGAPPQLAGFWIRFGGAFIDGILLGIINQILGTAVGTNLASLIGLVIGAGYFIYFHSSSGQTLGNKAVKIKVIDQASGGNIDAGRAFVRYLVSLVSGAIIALGYLWMLWDPNKQTWHDKAAKTVVIKLPG